jgi:SpoVK/Ycf46/Vps4 family AAA+-type ATPase
VVVQGEKCKQAITGKFKDKKVAGYHTAEDTPAFQNALAHVLQERQGSHKDEKTKKEVEQLIKNIRERGPDAEDKTADIPDAATGKIEGAGEKKEEEKKDSDSKLSSNLDPEVIKSINETILDSSPNVQWDDVKGLVEVKKILQETIVLPTVRPDIFKGLLSPSKGILLYGPPGNGKTMLAKAIATECKSTFFNVSASTLTSKWMGEGEKLMKCLFALAADKAPSVIFIDEIDSIMGARGGNEHEASRRLKTEFLI